MARTIYTVRLEKALDALLDLEANLGSEVFRAAINLLRRKISEDQQD